MKNPNLFNTVPVSRVKSTAFDLSHEVKSSFKIGQLVPFLCQEVLPGDVFKISAEHLVRFAPMLAPIMHRVDVFTHFFFVPNRLIWDEWEDFITGGQDGSSAPVPPVAVLKPSLTTIGTLADFLGVPPCPSSEIAPVPVEQQVSILPFRAYWRIYNDYYRDQNIEDEIGFSTGSGMYTLATYDLALRVRAYEKDYFTSALPWPQRSLDPTTIPISGEAEVYYNGRNNATQAIADGSPWSTTDGSLKVQKNALYSGDVQNSNGNKVRFDPNGTLNADLGEASGVTINELRRSMSLQRWLENAARVGSRYIEQILGHFGVRSSDARLQRAEYLGGGKSPVVISQVEQTSEAHDGGKPLGQLGGQGTSYGSSHRFKRRFEEHGFVMGIVSVLPKPSYQDGLPRMFTRRNKFDYYWPEFANLGEQEISNQELFLDWELQTNKGSNAGTFGYTPRYAEYRYIPSSVHGDFRESLDFWHMGRKFANCPGLNNDFIKANSGVDGGPDRVFAVRNVDHLWVQTYVKFNALRKMPKYGRPGL